MAATASQPHVASQSGGPAGRIAAFVPRQRLQAVFESGRKRSGALWYVGCVFERMLPVQLRLDITDGIQDALRPVLIFGMNDHNAKTVIMAFKLHALGVIDMQVDIEGWREFRGGVFKPVGRQGMAMANTVDHAVNTNAVQ